MKTMAKTEISECRISRVGKCEWCAMASGAAGRGGGGGGAVYPAMFSRMV